MGHRAMQPVVTIEGTDVASATEVPHLGRVRAPRRRGRRRPWNRGSGRGASVRKRATGRSRSTPAKKRSTKASEVVTISPEHHHR
jgi:hypothetical protein